MLKRKKLIALVLATSCSICLGNINIAMADEDNKERSTQTLDLNDVNTSYDEIIWGESTSTAWSSCGSCSINNISFTKNSDGDNTVSVDTDQFNYRKKSLSIPDKIKVGDSYYTVTRICYSAFRPCYNLISVKVPASVKTIEDQAFNTCSRLESIQVSPYNENYSSNDGILFNKDQTKIICTPKMYSSYEKVIWGEDSDTVWNSSGTCTINDIRFSNNNDDYSVSISSRQLTDAENLILPDKIKVNGQYYVVNYISRYAFEYCDNLSSIKLSGSINSISEDAFKSCKNLKAINVDINNLVFSSLDGVLIEKSSGSLICYPAKKEGQTYTIPDNVVKIASNAFTKCDNLTDIVIPKSITYISPYSFDTCSNLKNILSMSENAELSNYTFSNCPNLQNVTINDDNETFSSIDGVVFDKDQTNLILYPCGKNDSEYSVPNSVTNIYNLAFKDCSSLSSIILPPAITKISLGTFENCTNLNNIIIPDGVTLLDSSAFYGCSTLSTIVLPSSLTAIGRWCFADCSNLSSIDIPRGVECIDCYTFENCSTLSNVIIPDTVTKIDIRAFSNCSNLNNIIIPDSVTSIDDYAFKNCICLSSINIPDSVTSISEVAFKGCNNLKTIYCSQSQYEKFKNCFSDTVTVVTSNSLN